MFKRVRWIGPERILPNLGRAVEGREMELPVIKAASFIAQGLAEPIDLEEQEPIEEPITGETENG